MSWPRSSEATNSEGRTLEARTVATSTAMAPKNVSQRCRSTQPRDRAYCASFHSNAVRSLRTIAGSCRASPGTWARARRAESMGSSVKATKSEMSTAAVMVRPNWRKNWPTMPSMKATGTNTATRVRVVASTARAISCVPLLAATAGGSPRSSRRVMLSRTTTASSMSRPMASERPSRVSWLSENPSQYMRKSVPTTEVGSASAEMKVPRRSSRKTRMMRMAIAPPK